MKLANEAVNTVNEHPEYVQTNDKGDRHLDVGGGHEIVEVEGGCEFARPVVLKSPVLGWVQGDLRI